MSSPLSDHSQSVEIKDPFFGLERPNLAAPTVTGLDEICATDHRDPNSRKADLEVILDGCSSNNVHASNTAKKVLAEYLPKLLAQDGSAEPEFTKALLPFYLKILALYPNCAEGTDLENRIVTYGSNLLEPLRSTNYPQDVLTTETREELIQILKSDRAPGKSEILEQLKSAATQASKPGPISGAAFDFVAELAEKVNSCLVLQCYSQILKEYVAQITGFDDDFTKVVLERLNRKFGAQDSWPGSIQMTLAAEYRKVAEAPETSPYLRERAQRGLCNLLLAIGPKFGNDLTGIADIAIDTKNAVSPLASQLILSRVFRTDSDRMLVNAVEAATRILHDSKHPSSLAVCSAFQSLLRNRQSSEVTKALLEGLSPLLLDASGHRGTPTVHQTYTQILLKNRDIIREVLPTLREVIVKEPESAMGEAAWRYVKNIPDLTAYPNMYSNQRLAIYREILACKTHPLTQEAFEEASSLISDFNHGEAKNLLFVIAADCEHPLCHQARKDAGWMMWWGNTSSHIASPLAALVDDNDSKVRIKFGRYIPKLLDSAPGMTTAASAVLAILSDGDHEHYLNTRKAFLNYLDESKLSSSWIEPALPTVVGLAISPDSPLNDSMRLYLAGLFQSKKPDVSKLAIRETCKALKENAAAYLALPDTEFRTRQVPYIRALTDELLRASRTSAPGVDFVVTTLLESYAPAILDSSHECNAGLCEQIAKLYSPEDDKTEKEALPLFTTIISDPSHPLFTKAYSALVTWSTFKTDASAPRGLAACDESGRLLLEALPNLEKALRASNTRQGEILKTIARQFRYYSLEPGWAKLNFELSVDFLDGVKTGSISSSPDTIAMIYGEVRDTVSRFHAWNTLSPQEQERIIQVLK